MDRGPADGRPDLFLMAPSSPRPRVEDLLVYDLAVSSWIDREPDGRGVHEIPFGPSSIGLDPSLSLSDTLSAVSRLAGFDEAGRGALAGPVAVGCVAFDLGSLDASLSIQTFARALAGIDDSKRVTARRREDLFEQISVHATWSVGCSSAGEIDRIGIVAACQLAARRAYRNLGLSIDVALFDRGLTLGKVTELRSPNTPPRPKEATATGADGRSLHVAAASIVAKVARDRFMKRLGALFPEYGFGRHKGYGTAAHREALRRFGRTRIHRRTFAYRPENAKSQFC